MRRWICFFFIVCFALLRAETGRKICLNMIVKDESRVIEKCLNSVKDLIDYWVIVDTGSKDGTQKIIKKTMKGIPGELHERTWVDFAHNRNEALEFANCALLSGRWQEGFDACAKLITNPKVPTDVLPQIQANHELAKKHVIQ